MRDIEAKTLLKKYKAGLCTDEEKALIESWYLQLPGECSDLSPEELAAAVDRVERKLPVAGTKRQPLWPKLLAASVIIGIVSAGVFLIVKTPGKEQMSTNTPKFIKPGNKAILTLSGGQQITLDSSNSIHVATQGNVTITKTAAGEIQYNLKSSSDQSGKSFASNKITTPRGGGFELRLEDGTRVWLNAASSITYPAAFTGDRREVTTTGEVYFEVAKDKTRPFEVKSGKQTVVVLGTHFNINDYRDNGPVTETTLLEGSVKVSNGPKSAFIKPGQQAVASSMPGMDEIRIAPADTTDVIAWRKGDLQFDNENIRKVMNKVSRLYDMDVVYEGKISDEEFGGVVSHAQNVMQVLDVIQKTFNVHFKIEGRRITVMP